MKKILFISFAFLLVACSSPMDKKYSEETLEKDLKAIRDADKLDSTEAGLMVLYMMKAKFNGESLEGKTYKEILAAAKADDEKQNADTDKAEPNATGADGDVNETLAENTGDEQRARVAKLRQVLDVSFVDKGFFKGEQDNFISYEFALTNKTDNHISAFAGDVVIKDLIGAEIKVISLKYDNVIKANSTVKFGSTSDYDGEDPNDILLKSKTIDDVQLEWNPKRISYSDGTNVE